MKTKTKAKPKKQQKDQAFLELEGKINLVEVVNGRKKRSQLDGETCLKCLLLVIEEALVKFK